MGAAIAVNVSEFEELLTECSALNETPGGKGVRGGVGGSDVKTMLKGSTVVVPAGMFGRTNTGICC